MKRFFAFILLLTACSDKYDLIVANTQKADLHFSKDTVFVREKDYTNINQTGRGMVMVYASPAAHQLNLQFSEPSGKVHFSYRGLRLTDSQPFVVAADSSGLFCSVDTPGVYHVDFYLTDQLGRTVTKELIVKCTSGAKPIADLQYEAVSARGNNWFYYFNGLGSRQPYGAIVSYHYFINGDTILINRPLLKWYFHQSGSQQVVFYVIDDLGQSSDTINYTIQIP
ncbi:MAG: hypothetical protein V4450_17795 [Bacteroidota bacterium]